VSDPSFGFAKRGTSSEIEEGHDFAPGFDRDGLVTAIVVDAASHAVLMLAHMNDEALRRTLDSGEAHFFSRSRRRLWKKGEESGHVLRVVEMRTDCDQDAVLLTVEQVGPGACHTGRRSCFYRAVTLDPSGRPRLDFVDADKMFDPQAVYGKPPAV
jgi:phosphoribosyl-AMP cyclohydrolase